MAILNSCCAAICDCGHKLKSICSRNRGSNETGADVESTPIISDGKKSVQYAAVDRNVRESLTSGFTGFSSSTTALQLCFLNVLIYLCLAVAAFSCIFEKWTIIDSLYFAVVTFTTIGYGDMSPTSVPGQVFTMLFAIYGISILGVFLGIIGERIVEAQESALEKAEESARKSVMEMFSHSDGENETEDQNGSADKDTPNETEVKSIWVDIKDLAVHEAPIVCVIVAIALVIGHFEGWEIPSSLYYAVITSTTVGYGDLVPDTQAMKLLAIFFLPLAVAVFGEILGRIAGFYMDRKTAQAEKEFLKRQLTLSDLAIMDTDGDGDVSLAEFLSFMLVAMQKVDQESIDELKALFHSLDADGSGSLQKADLILLAQRSGKSKRRLGEFA